MARLLADRLPLSVHLHTDDFWHFIRQGWIAPYLPQAHRQNQTVIDVVAHAAADTRAVPLHYVVLRPDQTTTLQRGADRTDDALTDPEPIRSLHRQFTGIGVYEEHVLDSTHLTPQATADAVLHGLAEGAYHLAASPLRPEPDQ